MIDLLIFIGILYWAFSLSFGSGLVIQYFTTNPSGINIASNLTDRARVAGFIILVTLSIFWFLPYHVYIGHKSLQELFQGLTKESLPNLEHTLENVDLTIKETEQLLQKVRTE